MRVTISPEARTWLAERADPQVTVRRRVYRARCCVPDLPDLEVTLAPPPDGVPFNLHRLDGVDLYLEAALRTEPEVRLTLTGVGPFRRLALEGVRMVL
ncbi:MAG TPA: CC/Se motif family (seleno)protein [bacterium]|jgi:hypothetical protein